MGEPPDPGSLHEAPARLFTREQANRLVPTLESILRRMDPLLARLRELQELLEDHEAYWGAGLEASANSERASYLGILAEMADVRAKLEADAADIREAGAELKDVDLGLVDFHAMIDGQIAYLCWRRGEPWIGYWHTLEAGYAGRTPLPEVPRSEP